MKNVFDCQLATDEVAFWASGKFGNVIQKADIFICGHNHLDHFDPETIRPYTDKEPTAFVGPRLTCKQFEDIGISFALICSVDADIDLELPTVTIHGTIAFPTCAEVNGTTGYFVRFANGRAIDRTPCFAFDKLDTLADPRRIDAVSVSNQYEVASINPENPFTMAFLMQPEAPKSQCISASVSQPCVWSEVPK